MARYLAFGKIPPGFDCIKSFDDGFKQSMRRRGYLFLTPTGSSHFIYHAGVCCSDGLIIHLTQAEGGGSCSSSSGEGLYSKCSVKAFRNNKKEGRQEELMILKWRDGLPDDFDERVEDAMDCEEPYNVVTNNCITFALGLIGYDD